MPAVDLVEERSLVEVVPDTLVEVVPDTHVEVVPDTLVEVVPDTLVEVVLDNQVVVRNQGLQSLAAEGSEAEVETDVA